MQGWRQPIDRNSDLATKSLIQKQHVGDVSAHFWSMFLKAAGWERRATWKLRTIVRGEPPLCELRQTDLPGGSIHPAHAPVAHRLPQT